MIWSEPDRLGAVADNAAVGTVTVVVDATDVAFGMCDRGSVSILSKRCSIVSKNCCCCCCICCINIINRSGECMLRLLLWVVMLLF